MVAVDVLRVEGACDHPGDLLQQLPQQAGARSRVAANHNGGGGQLDPVNVTDQSG